MAKVGKARRHLCPYCSIRLGTTRDHVIPRCLFPERMPNGIYLPTVKACAECNLVKKSGDDTYLRDVLVTDMACAAHPTVQALLTGQANRAMRRNQSPFARDVHKTARSVHLQTRSGLYIGRAYTADVDLKRLHRIFARITRGLHFKRQKELLPQDILFTVMRVSVDTITEFMKVPDRTWYRPPSLGDVFACYYCLGLHETFETLWLMGFYDQFCVVVRTGTDLTALPPTSRALETALWAASDLSVIPRPDSRVAHDRAGT